LDQDALGLGHPQLPGDAGGLDRGERGGAGAAVVADDGDVIGTALDAAGGDRSDPCLGAELHRDLRGGVGAAQVVDQLLQVLDRVDVVVGRGRGQFDAGGGEAQVPAIG